MSPIGAAEQLLDTAVPQIRGAKWIAIGVAILLAIAAIAAAGWWFFVRPRAAQVSAATARVEAATAGATAGAAQDALKLRIEVDQQHVAIDTITRTNDHAIQSAAGAAVPIDPALGAAGRRALCMRGAYRADPGCAALRPAGGSVRPADPDTGGGASGE